ncbi:unnamed protein product [marine sediment metagenome]|uniref:Uncharacterized protein n=1 Tax=marine sediment metagenome TaxID=412755 RepID=X0YY93_9ZZZZ
MSINEDNLTRLDIAIVGALNRGTLLSYYAKEGYVPSGDGKAPVWLVCGRRALIGLIGEPKFEEIQALSKYGNERAVRRSGWEPYCLRHDNRWLVTCIDPAKLRKMRWLNKPNLVAAVRHTIHLATGGEPATPAGPIERVELWRATND